MGKGKATVWAFRTRGMVGAVTCRFHKPTGERAVRAYLRRCYNWERIPWGTDLWVYQR